MSDIAIIYPRIDAAEAIVSTELETIQTETNAFESFLMNVRRLEPTGSVSLGTGGTLATATSFTGFDPAAIRQAYRETILAMAHYDSEYGEHLLDNVEIEFGESVRAVLESEMALPPMTVGVIETAAEQAVTERQDFSRVLSEELESLERIRDQLGDIEARFHELTEAIDQPDSPSSDDRNRLETLAKECQTLSVDRQETLHHRSAPYISGIGDRSLVAYLYHDCEHQFPALIEIADVAGRINSRLGREGSLPRKVLSC